MKMDMDVIRKILEHIREHDGGVKGVDVVLADVPQDVVVYHLPLLVDAGWIVAAFHGHHGGGFWDVRRLTYEGHVAITNMQVPGVWQRTKTALEKAGGAVSTPILKILLERGVREALDLL